MKLFTKTKIKNTSITIKVFIISVILGGFFLLGVMVGHYKYPPFTSIYKIKNIITMDYVESPTYDASVELLNSHMNHETYQCSNKDNNSYSFFAAGHTYGDPNNQDLNIGLYPKFIKEIEKINQCDNMMFGLFLGDIVQEASNNSFNSAKKDMDLINKRIKKYIIPGNHDVGIGPKNDKRNIFDQHFDNSYGHFEYNDDLFILLDSNFDNWNIPDQQLKFLTKLRDSKKKFKNIFIFTHQVIWYDRSKKLFKRIKPNSWEGLENKSNFWSQVFPIASSIGENTFFFSGDVGALQNGSEFFYNEHLGVKFFATGMGGGQKDNFLIASIVDGHVIISLIPID